MASIHSHGNGFRVHFVKDGKKSKSGSLATEQAAQLWIIEQLPAQVDRTILGIIELWRKELPTDYRNDASARLARVVVARGWIHVEKFTLAELTGWITRDPSWRMPCCYLLSVLRWAARVHRVPVRDEVLKYRPPAPERVAKPPLLSDDQMNWIRDCAMEYGPRAFAIVDYLSTYGARPITACRMMYSSLDLEHGELVLGARKRRKKAEALLPGKRGEKHSGSWRHVLFDRHLEAWPELVIDGEPSVTPLFAHYKEDRPWRIQRGRATEITDWYHNTIAKKLRNRLGELAGIYHLKRYAITSLFRAGVDPATISLFTGHLSLDQVMTYATSNADIQRGALAKLDGLRASVIESSQAGSQVPTK